MTSSAMTYPDWKAPSEDGKLLICPAPGEICRETLNNQKALSTASVRIQNVPLAEVRRDVRQALGHEDDRPLVADGHQTELYHAGVWAKSVMANQIAARVGGRAAHLAVDTDAPKHLTVRWPEGAEPITDDPQLTRAHWSGLLKPPSKAHLSELECEIAEYRFLQKPMIGGFLALLGQVSQRSTSLSAAMTDAQHALDAQLGLTHRAILASPIWESRGFLMFAHHLISRAGAFAAVYNAALADYRREHGIRTISRPMPDLAAFEDSIELPLWLDELATGSRTRPTAFACETCENGYVITLPNGEEFYFDATANGFTAAEQLGQWLKRNRVRFSPRALVLTMFIRLCAADQFIHGIGGGRYDQVTDRIIANYFKIEPPRFSVTTATMYLPEAAGRARICVPCIEREGHALRHSALGEAKREYLDKIERSPRHSRERYKTFVAMHRALAGAMTTAPAIREWQLRLEDARERESGEAVLFDRELFYALQPQGRLAEMIERFGDQFAER